MPKTASRFRTGRVQATGRLRSALCFVALWIAGSAFAIDTPETELRNFLPRLQAAAKRGPSAVVPFAHFPLRVNFQSDKVLMLSAAEFKKSYDDIFTPTVLARLAQATPDEVARDRGMVGMGALYIEAACEGVAQCDHPVPLVTVINVNVPPVPTPGVDYREKHCRYEHKGRSYPCSADNWLLRWLNDQPLLKL